MRKQGDKEAAIVTIAGEPFDTAIQARRFAGVDLAMLRRRIARRDVAITQILDDQDTAIHAAALSYTRLDALIDRHVFNREQWCRGYCEYSHMEAHSVAVCPCTVCGAVERRTLAQRYAGSTGHERKVPRYTQDRAGARQIVDAIGLRGKTAQSCFTLYLSEYCPRGRNRAHWLLFGATPREVALAALRVVGVIDEQGYIVVEERQG